MDDAGQATERGEAGCAGRARPQPSLTGTAAGLTCVARQWIGRVDEGASQADDAWANEGTDVDGVDRAD
jgi:uncharacterized damage-inducible protein DinB